MPAHRTKINKKVMVEVKIKVTTEDIEVENKLVAIHWVAGILEITTIREDESTHPMIM